MLGALSQSVLLNSIYVFILFSSALFFLYLRVAWKKYVPEIFFWTHFTIVSWSALMYLNLVFDTPIKPFVWYADWILSTPLIMLALAMTAMYPLSKINRPVIFALIANQAMIIITGVFAQIAPTQVGMLTFFGIGNVFMLIVFYLVWYPLMAIARENKNVYTKYRRLVMLLVFFWISYPVVWIIGTPGLAYISPFMTNLLFVVLPILCKPVFGLIDLYLLKSMYSEN